MNILIHPQLLITIYLAYLKEHDKNNIHIKIEF